MNLLYDSYSYDTLISKIVIILGLIKKRTTRWCAL